MAAICLSGALSILVNYYYLQGFLRELQGVC